MGKQYWSQRKGVTDKLDLSGLKKIFSSLIFEYIEKGYFQECLGFACVNGDNIPGTAVSDYIFRKTRRVIEWPIKDGFKDCDEDTIFDMIEFFYDTVSFPVEGYFHSFNQCAHYYKFDGEKGKGEYRKELNLLLTDYNDGYELNKLGQIENLLEPGLKELTEVQIPSSVSQNQRITKKIEKAIFKFRDRHSGIEDRREGIRELADVLEYIRFTVKEEMLTKDEGDLFNIANNFAIRHNNDKQKENYGLAWLSWIFHLYLATIHLCLRVGDIEKYSYDRN